MNTKNLDIIARDHKPYFWTDEELDILDKYYDRVPVRALAETLGRSVYAVRTKASLRRRD